MHSLLSIHVQDLLHAGRVESARIEFKASWDEKTTGPQIVRTICGFANDFQNLNGGYIVLGVAEAEGRAQLPPKGLTTSELEKAQRWLRGQCNRIDPIYQPILSPEIVDDRQILVIFAPGSESRPHQAPDDKGTSQFYIRLGSETTNASAKPELIKQLLQLTARTPFDDRRALHASVDDIRETKVREFLHDTRSGLLEEQDSRNLYRQLRIADPVNGHDAPRNIGLLFFSQDPQKWFSGARIEVVQFAAGEDGTVLNEQVFAQRPIHEQLRDCLAYLESLSHTQIQKLPNTIHAKRWGSYPVMALREALANAVYHRSYENDVTEPIKVYLYEDRMEIISYPGPVPGLEIQHLEGKSPLPPVPARNRRIGEMLKDLKLAEGRGTGIPKLRRAMETNGSPPPRFDFDATRSYFRVTLPAHPEYLAILALRDIAHLKSLGEGQAALLRLQQAVDKYPISLSLALELVRELCARSDLHAATAVYQKFVQINPHANPASLVTQLARACLDEGRRAEALAWLDKLPHLAVVDEAIDAAIQEKRAGRMEKSHKYFQLAGEAVYADAKALHEFAQVKMKLAGKLHHEKSKAINKGANKAAQSASNRRLLDEARTMLHAVLQMVAPAPRHAWAWHDLAQVLEWSNAPRYEVRNAYQHALDLMPSEERFLQALQGFPERD